MRKSLGALVVATLAIAGCSNPGTPHQEVTNPPIQANPPPPQRYEFDVRGAAYATSPGLFAVSTVAISTLPNCVNKLAPTRLCPTAITVDGETGGPEDLVSGSYITAVGGVWDPPETDNAKVVVDVQHAVRGRVEAIDPDRLELFVLGQRVFVYNATLVPSLAEIAVGDRVTVSGPATREGVILATRVASGDGRSGSLVRGVLSSRPGGRFGIGLLDLDLSNAAVEGFPGGAIAAGDPAIAIAAGDAHGGVLAVDTLRFAGGDFNSPFSYTRFAAVTHGIVTAGSTADDIEVNGVRVHYAVCDCPQPGDLVTVWSEDGLASVTKARLTPHSVELTAPITESDGTRGRLNVLGFNVQMIPMSLIDGQSRHSFISDEFEIDDLSVGQWVTVRGGLAGDIVVPDRIDTQATAARTLHAWQYTLDRPAIVLGGQRFVTNESTVVTRCNVAADRDWLFAEGYGVVSIDLADDARTATKVEVCSYLWDD